LLTSSTLTAQAAKTQMDVVPKVLVTSTFVDEQRLRPTPWVLAVALQDQRQGAS
jgi:hypothetical protein